MEKKAYIKPTIEFIKLTETTNILESSDITVTIGGPSTGTGGMVLKEPSGTRTKTRNDITYGRDATI